MRPSLPNAGQGFPVTPNSRSNSSFYSSTAPSSQPRDTEPFQRDFSVQPSDVSRRASIDGGTRTSSHWAPSSHHSRDSSMSSSHFTSRSSSSRSSLPQTYHYPPDSQNYVPTSTFSSQSPSMGHTRRNSTSASTASHRDFYPTARHSPTPVIPIPAARPSDLTFDPAKKRDKKGSSSRSKGWSKSSTSSRSSRRDEADDRSRSAKPIKYRFVSVQHAEQSGAGRSSGIGYDDGRGSVQLEEHMEEEEEEDEFEHGPTELPPRPYPGGVYATSPYSSKKAPGKITASNLDRVRPLFSFLS